MASDIVSSKLRQSADFLFNHLTCQFGWHRHIFTLGLTRLLDNCRLDFGRSGLYHLVLFLSDSSPVLDLSFVVGLERSVLTLNYILRTIHLKGLSSS